LLDPRSQGFAISVKLAELRVVGSGLPEFLVVGAPRSGTTSIASALATHPGVFVPARKELSFFDENWDRGFGWYARYFEDAHHGQLRGEATPGYFASPAAAERIARTNAACKLVVLARDPIERALSHYWLRWSSGRETRALEQVIADETASPEAHASGYLFAHGMYGRNLRRYHGLFGRDAVHVVVFDELASAPDRVLDGCQRFLGVPVERLALDHENGARAPRSLLAIRALARFGRSTWRGKRIVRGLIGEARVRALRDTIYAVLMKPAPKPPFSEASKARLREAFADDLAVFHEELGRTTGWDD
jgi:hypothetical protein